ncbi:M48 family peptidase [Brasilonema sp. UFV-L1]|uniref:M48 family peptidase n=1 Tax=Brasilonema sp. UFV-L1 TaxID=2234130 RepID=UPI001B7CE6E4|nr:M48 family peptidase [Brasilonema sp. UFV-L1]
MQTISLKNIKTQQRAILQRISHLASTVTPSATEIKQLTQIITQNVTAIEQICAASQATPANLTRCSRHIYAWMKFLNQENNLQLHIKTTQKVKQIAQQICQAHGHSSVNIIVEFIYLAGLCKYKHSPLDITLTLNEGFINANDETLEALVKIGIFGKCQYTTQLIRSYAESEEYSDVLMELDVITEVVVENAKGKWYDLDELFEKINHEYFACSLVKPRLAWSGINTYRKLGHYEAARDRVMMALTLDDASIPQFVIEFVLYHELLHKYHGATWVNGRRMVHTSEFRRDERKFRLYKEAEEWLTKLAFFDR